MSITPGVFSAFLHAPRYDRRGERARREGVRLLHLPYRKWTATPIEGYHPNLTIIQCCFTPYSYCNARMISRRAALRAGRMLANSANNMASTSALAMPRTGKA
jgi:hypothetical protein